MLAPGAPGVPASHGHDGVKVHRANYWINRWQVLTVGLGGIVPNLRQRPWLGLQVVPLIASLAWHAVRFARGCDVIHAHWVYPGGVAGLIASRLCKVPLIVISHGGDLNLAQRSRLLRLLSRWVSRAADTCVAVSTAMVEQFVALGIPRDRIKFIPLGVGTAWSSQSVATSKCPALGEFCAYEGLRVLYVGSLIPRKSVETLIEAHQALRNRGRRLICAIVGAGPSASELRRQAAGSSHGGILFVGEVPPHSVGPWRSAAHVLVLPSMSEGRPIAVLEAMSAGLPVVASDVPGTRELVSEGTTGMLFPPGSSPALADRLERLIVDPELGRQMGLRARDRVTAEGLSVEASARRFVELSRGALSPSDSKQACI